MEYPARRYKHLCFGLLGMRHLAQNEKEYLQQDWGISSYQFCCHIMEAVDYT